MAGKRKPGASTLEPTATVIADEAHHMTPEDWEALRERARSYARPKIMLMGYDPSRPVE